MKIEATDIVGGFLYN